MTRTRIRTLVVDDQPMARDRLVHLLAAESDVELVGTCASGAEAVRSIRAMSPDVVFLDMQMPELDGLGVVEAVGVDRMPLTIFVTAYDEYAVRAFEAEAFDYLLKPFARPRFARAVQRVRDHLDGRARAAMTDHLRNVMESMRDRTQPHGRRLVVKSGGRIQFVDVSQIDWVEADGNYAHLHLSTGDSVLIRDTLTELADRLGASQFFRIHRSRLVNVDRVKELRVGGGGDYDVVLLNGTYLGLSRGCKEALQARLTASVARSG